MKSLVRKVLERAASEGGEEWLRRYLAELEEEPALVPEEKDAIVGPSASEAACVPPPLQMSPSVHPQACRSLKSQPPKHPSGASASREEEEADDNTTHPRSQRISKKKRPASPSPVRVTTGRGRSYQSPVLGRQCLFPF